MNEWLRSIDGLSNVDQIVEIFREKRIHRRQLLASADSILLLQMGLDAGDAIRILHALRHPDSPISSPHTTPSVEEPHTGDREQSIGEKKQAIYIDLDNAEFRVIYEPVALQAFERQWQQSDEDDDDNDRRHQTDTSTSGEHTLSSSSTRLAKQNGGNNNTFKHRIKRAMRAQCTLFKPISKLARNDMFEVIDSGGEHFFARVCKDGRTKGVSVNDLQKILNREHLVNGILVRLRITYAIRFGNRYTDTDASGRSVTRCIYSDRFYKKKCDKQPVDKHRAGTYEQIFAEYVKSLTKRKRKNTAAADTAHSLDGDGDVRIEDDECGNAQKRKK